MRWLAMVCLLLALCPRPGVAQGAGQVGGMVTDAAGAPLAGAAVNVAGTARSALTGADGRYLISGVPAGSHRVRATRVGHTEQTQGVTVAAGQTASANFRLAAQAVELEGIVAVGYGTVRKSDLTGSVASLKVDEAKTGVTQSVAQVLSGRVPGVQVIQSSGEPGAGVRIRIRGTGSINAGNDPLYVIDGLPIDNGSATPDAPFAGAAVKRNPLAALSPDDIQSIEVLKDASATAIYGSRGANGVVMITTKRGRASGYEVNYEGYAGYQAPTRQLDLMTTSEYMAFMNDVHREMGQAAPFSPADIAAIGAGTDWQSEIFRTSPVSSHHLSFSGGGEASRLYASLSAFDQEGVVISSATNRYVARANLEQSAGDRLRLGLNMNASFTGDDFVPTGRSGNENAGVINAALYQEPTLARVNPDGSYPQSTVVNLENPLGIAHGVDDFGRTSRTFGNAFAELNLLEGLQARVNLGSDRQLGRRDTYLTTLMKEGQERNGMARAAAVEASTFLAEFTMNYKRNLGDAHRFDLLGGYTYQNFSRSNMMGHSENFISDAFRTNNLGAGDRETYQVGSGQSRNQLLSYLGRANYNLLDRYLLTASFRADGSSRFGQQSKFGYFPSVALAWRVLDEPMLQSQRLFSDLKARVSYGLTGNQDIGNYNSLVLLGVQGEAYIGGGPRLGISPTQVANPDLKWETTSQFNLGLDFGFLDNRVTGSADYFTKHTDDLLLNLPIPATSGFTAMLMNVGAVRNHGWELQLNTENLVGPLEWTTSFNASSIRNRVTDLAGLPRILQGGAAFANEMTILREGDPMNSYYGYVVDGVWQTGDDIAGSPQPGARPGEFRFRDVNGDGQITADDRTILGSPFPDLSLGMNNAFTYGPVELSAFVQASLGVELLDMARIESENPISFRRNRYADLYRDRWTPQNPTNNTSSGVPVRVAYGGAVNSRAVHDASYLRLKNLELRYRLPAERFGLRSTSVFLSGQNLWTLTDYPGFDPEANGFGESNVVVDINTYPVSRIVTAGVRVGL